MSVESDLVEQQGQPLDLPSNTPGQEVTGTPTSLTEEILAATEAAKEAPIKNDPPAEKPVVETEKKPDEPAKETDKPKPYDQDPKWKAARSAQASLEKILKENDLDDVDALNEAIEGGKSLKEILGAADAKQLKKDSAKLKEIEAYWAKQDEKKKEEEEEPDETKARLKQELQDLKDKIESDKAAATKATEVDNALEGYNNSAEKSITDAGLTGEDADMARLFLGVGNPFNEIDISDMKIVKSSNKSGAEKFSEWLKGVRQTAVDEYAKGKSEIIPITPTEVTPPAAETKAGKEETVDEANKSAKSELLSLMGELVKPG